FHRRGACKMSQCTAFEGIYQGERAVWLKAGTYEAALLPGVGGNLIAFRDTETGYRFLREPAESEMDAFRANASIHGIPVLCPPNRCQDGKLPWRGKVYQSPVNEAKTGNHLHGYAHQSEWTLVQFGATEHESYAEVALTVDESHLIYKYLPHK